MVDTDFAAEISAVRSACETAVDSVLDAAEAVSVQARAIAPRDPAAAAALDAAVGRIMEACAFQDLVGQRLDRLASPGRYASSLTAGPGGDFDQTAADALFAR